MTPRCCRTPDLAASRGFPIPARLPVLGISPTQSSQPVAPGFIPGCGGDPSLPEAESQMQAIIVIIGTLVPTLAATTYYVMDRNRH